MQTEGIISKLDELFKENKGYEAQNLLMESIEQAKQEEDDNALLILYNELIGFKRETSQVEDSYAYAEEAIKLMDKMGIKDSRPYATTLLNIANAYRAGGRLEDSLKLYQRVITLYKDLVSEYDMLFASLYNNISLLYQEMGDFIHAGDALIKALSIVVKNEDTTFEEAVTESNLASVFLQLKNREEAKKYYTHAIQLFQELNVRDTHYASALSAKGTYLYQTEQYKDAEDCFLEAMDCVKSSLGENEYYRRLVSNVTMCRSKQTDLSNGGGLALSKAYYLQYGKKMIHEQFKEFENQIAVGLVGEGSDCFKFDDDVSRDHDWGPGFCMWTTNEVYEKIGEKLQEAYDKLPKEFMGYTRRCTPQGKNRVGVSSISGFYERILGEQAIKIDPKTGKTMINWRSIPDEALAASVNGLVFEDAEGIFTAIRKELKKGYPTSIRLLKLAQACGEFSQGAQYNFRRMSERGDSVSAMLSLSQGMRSAMQLMCYLDNQYPMHDKWLYRQISSNSDHKIEAELIKRILTTGQAQDKVVWIEELAEKLADKLYETHAISTRDNYLDFHTDELCKKARLFQISKEALIKAITELEFEAFDKVRNEGGRASCQNDWETFSKMRMSQYQTWNDLMLVQYYYDFEKEYRNGHNLIEEKYGRMMESTAPDEYDQIKEYFPVLSKEKKQIIEAIVQLQVGCMEEFAKTYPKLTGNMRTISTNEDTAYNTSYETYLRGEISTYSDKMLELYGRFITTLEKEGKNPVTLTIQNSIRLYGYQSLEEAEKATSF